MASLAHRVFHRKTFVETVVAEALEAQTAFEAQHPIPYTDDQRLAAVLLRAELKARRHGAKVIPKAKIEALVRAKLGA